MTQLLRIATAVVALALFAATADAGPAQQPNLGNQNSVFMKADMSNASTALAPASGPLVLTLPALGSSSTSAFTVNGTFGSGTAQVILKLNGTSLDSGFTFPQVIQAVMNTGYTGNGETFAIRGGNVVNGSNPGAFDPRTGNIGSGDMAIEGQATGDQLTDNLNTDRFGLHGYVARGKYDAAVIGEAVQYAVDSTNWGTLGTVFASKNAGSAAEVHIGVEGMALNGNTNVGVLAALYRAAGTLTSAALLADNGAQAVPIIVGKDNGTDKWRLEDGGLVGVATAAAGTCSAGALTVTVSAHTMTVIPNGAACTLTLATTTVSGFSLDTDVLIVINGGVGAGVVTIAATNFTHVPTSCSTTGMVNGDAALFRYSKTLGVWVSVGGCLG